MMAKLQGGGTSLYDIVVPSQYLIPVMAKLGLLAELRHANIPNLANLDDKFVNPRLRPGQQVLRRLPVGHGRHLPAQEARQGSSTRPGALLFDKKKQYGSFLLMDSVREMLGSALKYQGMSVNSTNPDELRASRAIAGRGQAALARVSRAASAARTRCWPRRSTPPWSTTATPCAA